jgi:hypothetical protein
MLRFAVAALALVATGCLSAASSDSAAQHAPADPPTRLDYLLLASLADTQQLLSMAAYRPTPSP